MEYISKAVEPTQKQIEYAEYLGKRMCQELPSEFTRKAYSAFIDELKPFVKHKMTV